MPPGLDEGLKDVIMKDLFICFDLYHINHKKEHSSSFKKKKNNELYKIAPSWMAEFKHVESIHKHRNRYKLKLFLFYAFFDDPPTFNLRMLSFSSLIQDSILFLFSCMKRLDAFGVACGNAAFKRDELVARGWVGRSTWALRIALLPW